MAKRESKRKSKITIKIDNLLGNVPLAKPWHKKHLLAKTGGPMKAAKGKGTPYNRKKSKKAWRKDQNL